MGDLLMNELEMYMKKNENMECMQNIIKVIELTNNMFGIPEYDLDFDTITWQIYNTWITMTWLDGAYLVIDIRPVECVDMYCKLEVHELNKGGFITVVKEFNPTEKYMKDYFRGEKTSLHIFYRRKFDTEFKLVMMEIVPAMDYSDQEQSLFLYVKNIDR